MSGDTEEGNTAAYRRRNYFYRDVKEGNRPERRRNYFYRDLKEGNFEGSRPGFSGEVDIFYEEKKVFEGIIFWV